MSELRGWTKQEKGTAGFCVERLWPIIRLFLGIFLENSRMSRHFFWTLGGNYDILIVVCVRQLLLAAVLCMVVYQIVESLWRRVVSTDYSLKYVCFISKVLSNVVKARHY